MSNSKLDVLQRPIIMVNTPNMESKKLRIDVPGLIRQKTTMNIVEEGQSDESPRQHNIDMLLPEINKKNKVGVFHETFSSNNSSENQFATKTIRETTSPLEYANTISHLETDKKIIPSLGEAKEPIQKQ